MKKILSEIAGLAVFSSFLLASFFGAPSIPPAYAQFKVVQTCPGAGINYAIGSSSNVPVMDVNGNACNISGPYLAVTGGVKVERVPIGKLIETFDNAATLDLNNWVPATVTGTA